ncbi:MAG: 30S ribosome-binding factor RbfA [Acidobacteria bacterium]|nr:30S ribosome-binding factor RbfA [Acidobacteriota bacterium]MCA1642979.1 30S ribosome-binding factor RbfA [Acidobacteriota bacterium]
MRRPERVGEQLRAEIVQIVGYELEDPRVAMVTVTDVRMSENLREARVYFTVAGTDEEARSAHKALNHAAPYVRRQLATELSLRHAPQIFFIRDTVEEKAARVDALLQEITHDSPPPPGRAHAAAGEEGERMDEG